MPALPLAPGVAKLVVVQNQAGVTINNVLHAYKNDNAVWTASDIATLASTLRSAWVTNVLPLQAVTVTLTDVVATDLSADNGLSSTATGSNAGSNAGTNAPANAAICWSWKQLVRYRGGHPRTYIAGLTTGNMTTANTISSTHKNAHATAAAAIRTAINALTPGGAAVALCAVSYYHNKALRPVPVPLVYTGVSVDDRIDSQRRRLGRDRS